jgi:hypothetical protein
VRLVYDPRELLGCYSPHAPRAVNAMCIARGGLASHGRSGSTVGGRLAFIAGDMGSVEICVLLEGDRPSHATAVDNAADGIDTTLYVLL